MSSHSKSYFRNRHHFENVGGYSVNNRSIEIFLAQLLRVANYFGSIFLEIDIKITDSPITATSIRTIVFLFGFCCASIYTSQILLVAFDSASLNMLKFVMS